MQDRDVRVAERDLRRFHRAAQIRGEHRSDAVIAAPPGHLGGIGTALLASDLARCPAHAASCG
jgi:hypothetical protein